MNGYSVEGEDGFARVYEEDETVTIRKGDLRALLDVATGSMDFGSGFLDNEQVEVLRRLAPFLGIDPDVVTPPNFKCAYGHTFVAYSKRCVYCGRLPQSEGQL